MNQKSDQEIYDKQISDGEADLARLQARKRRLKDNERRIRREEDIPKIFYGLLLLVILIVGYLNRTVIISFIVQRQTRLGQHQILRQNLPHLLKTAMGLSPSAHRLSREKKIRSPSHRYSSANAMLSPKDPAMNIRK